jgi:flagellar basal-body rod protein FlgB
LGKTPVRAKSRERHMNLDTIPLFAMLKSRLGYENQRQKLISQNVANTDTPTYAPKDLKTFTVTTAESGSGKLGMVQPATTNPGHLAAPDATGKSQWKVITSSDSETTLDGNKVVLEDQMAKMAESRMNYEAAIGFYQKSLAMLQLAARIPGK